MGVERVVDFAGQPVPEWAAVADRLRELGEAPVLRMIDGLPAFPDEIPEPDWQELRVGLAGGMVTVRRSLPDSVTCVTWGTGEPALVLAWNRLAWAFAAAGGGCVRLSDGEATADQFRAAHLPHPPSVP